MLERINRLQETCEACLYAKRNRPKDRGLVGCLPLPDLVNSLVYVDFIDRKRLWAVRLLSYDCGLLIKFLPSCALQEKDRR